MSVKACTLQAPEVLQLLIGTPVTLYRPVRLPARKPTTIVFREANPTGVTWFEETRHTLLCPYGAVGDRLRVKEAWGYGGCSIRGSGPTGQYKATALYLADGTHRELLFATEKALRQATPKQKIKTPPGYDNLNEWDQEQVYNRLLSAWWHQSKTQPASKMPLRFSRLTVEITDVEIQTVDAAWMWAVSVKRV